MGFLGNTFQVNPVHPSIVSENGKEGLEGTAPLWLTVTNSTNHMKAKNKTKPPAEH